MTQEPDIEKLYKETNDIISRELSNGFLFFHGFSKTFAEAILPKQEAIEGLSPMEYFEKVKEGLSNLLSLAEKAVPEAEDPTDTKSDKALFLASKKSFMFGANQIEACINGVIVRKSIGDKLEFRMSVESATTQMAQGLATCLEIAHKSIKDKGVIGRISNSSLGNKIKSFLNKLDKQDKAE